MYMLNADFLSMNQVNLCMLSLLSSLAGPLAIQ